jgi:two-component system chemotaxis sensor kinase CheA
MPRDVFEYFRVEANDLVDQIDAGTVALERSADGQPVAQLLRLTHTLKGAARVVGHHPIAEAAHALEGCLGAHRDGTADARGATMAAMFAYVDELRAHLAELPSPDEPAHRPRPAAAAVTVAGTAATALEDREGPPPGPRAVGEPPGPGPGRPPSLESSDVDVLLERISEATAHLAGARRGVAAVRDARASFNEALTLPTDQVSAAVATQRLTSAMARAHQLLTDSVNHIDRELANVREAAETLRLVPARTMFSALARAVRDAAEVEHKNVVFEGRGGDIRVGPAMLRDVQRGLLHVVRNGVVHGIEPPAARPATGKDPQGTIVVTVARHGRRVSFQCRDDGRGIDLVALRAAVAEAGTHPEPDRLDDEALLRYVFLGGISTSDTVSQIAGRGVGLDVLRSLADDVGGEVAISTESGRGTTVGIVVPVAGVAVEALVVRAGGRSVALPLATVRRGLRLAGDDMLATPSGAHVMDGDSPVPYVPLTDLLPGPPAAGGTGSNGDGHRAVLVDGRGGTVAVGVDRFVGCATLYVRPLPAAAAATGVVAGLFLDPDGDPQLMLDPDGLAAAQRTPRAPAPREPPAERAPILVVDDSLTTRMVEQAMLEAAGYTVHLATNGEEALDMAQRTRYGLFLVDVEMPRMDGVTFIEHIRADPVLHDVPAILVTSLSSPADRRRGERAGATDHLVKHELDRTYLLDRIATLMG